MCIVQTSLNFLFYFEAAPPDSDYFTINPDSCEVRYVNGFDREVQASHTITLELADIAIDAGHSPSRTVQTTLTIRFGNTSETLRRLNVQCVLQQFRYVYETF
jgi:hypothetical protein